MGMWADPWVLVRCREEQDSEPTAMGLGCRLRAGLILDSQEPVSTHCHFSSFQIDKIMSSIGAGIGTGLGGIQEDLSGNGGA